MRRPWKTRAHAVGESPLVRVQLPRADAQIHAHVEGRTHAVGESPLVRVQLPRADAQVEQGPVQSALLHFHVVHRVVEPGMQEANPNAEGFQGSAGMGQGFRVAVHRQEAASGAALQEKSRVASAPDRAVQVEASRPQPQEVHDLPPKHGLVVPTAGVSVVHGASMWRA
jgi:hypothetical protein